MGYISKAERLCLDWGSNYRVKSFLLKHKKYYPVSRYIFVDRVLAVSDLVQENSAAQGC